ncbi:related to integral membrane protein PTH11 [Phialocephala subalpina]|uniref:Related to integral membrane protein PTH11 n=1 Tax=Phialocephala subalpina TaxID=576137 RepID=A0A1L7WZ13_9HELO|nr:related to integral membrane protein PTH11 [Phialocephala subalpina]
MDILRLVTEAPDITTPRDDKPTLLVSWWCTCYAVAIIAIRVCGRYIRAEKVFIEDGIMMLAVTPLLIRMAFVHVVLKDGTNNTVTDGLSTQDIRRREMGSQLVLAARVFYAAYLWAIKYSTSMFLRTLTESVWQRQHQKLLRYLHIFLGLTFLATVVVDLGACQPFNHYWQVVPDPGPACRTGSAHLYTMGVLNIVTNLVLIIFPIPVLWKAKISRKQKASIMARLALPLLSIAFVSYSLPRITSHHFSQQVRSLLASLDILLSTFISNAVVLFSLLSDRGYKKSKYKFQHPQPYPNINDRKGSTTGPTNMTFENGGRGRRPSRWGSDEDLMRVGSDEVLISGKKGVVIGMQDLGVMKEREGEERSKEFGDGRRGLGSRLGSHGGRVRRPEEAKLGDIRVASTWEIRVDDK